MVFKPLFCHLIQLSNNRNVADINRFWSVDTIVSDAVGGRINRITRLFQMLFSLSFSPQFQISLFIGQFFLNNQFTTKLFRMIDDLIQLKLQLSYL